MFRILKLIVLTIAVSILSVGLLFLVKKNSEKLSVHRASLECTYKDMNTFAAEYYGDLLSSKYHVQLRYDWINDNLLYLQVGSDSEDGIGSKRTLAEKPNVYVEEYKENGKIEFQFLINRETLKIETALYDVKTGVKKLWVKSDCVSVVPSIFEQNRKKAISRLKAKQKI